MSKECTVRGVSFIGPLNSDPTFQSYDLAYEGKIVPYLTAHYHVGDDAWEISIVRPGEKRYGVLYYQGFKTQEEVAQLTPLVANAMAVAAGYASFGNRNPPANLFNCQVGFLGDSGPKKHVPERLQIVRSNTAIMKATPPRPPKQKEHKHKGPGCHDCRGSGNNCRDCCTECNSLT